MQIKELTDKCEGATPEVFTGVIERIIYFNEENFYCIAELLLEKTQKSIVITGALPSVQCGETLEVSGSWVSHAQHGSQFKVSSFQSRLPASIYGIRKYLGSGLIAGIGKNYANKIVDAFGEDTLRIISEESARLQDIPGIGRQRARAIKAAWEEQSALREVMIFLQTYGISCSQCIRLVKAYGNEAKIMLQKEPYRIAREIQGIGFKTADKIALNLGFANDSPARLDAGILFAMQEIQDQGHTCFEEGAFYIHASELLQTDIVNIRSRCNALVQEGSLCRLFEYRRENTLSKSGEKNSDDWIQSNDSDEIKLDQLRVALQEKRCSDGNTSLQLPHLYRAEMDVAEHIYKILHAPSHLPPIDVDKAIEWAQSRAGFTFAPEQIASIRTALIQKISIITGGPGTGKTTILRALVSILRAKKVSFLLAAPTGRAAQRMSESAGAFAQTIHRLLKFDVGLNQFIHHENNALPANYIIVDEASMLDIQLAASLIRAILVSSHIVFVGDIFQLPSVGPGNVLKDLIYSGMIPMTQLNQVFRQKGRSHIVTTAHAILEGRVQPTVSPCPVDAIDPKKDLHFIATNDVDTVLAMVASLSKDWIPKWYEKDPFMDVQVLAPLYKGTAGISSLNQSLQKALNGNSMQSRSIAFGAVRFSVGDKVIQQRNNYDKGVFNGDLGRVESLDSDSGILEVRFDHQLVLFERSELSELALAYAISIHKSQGSEFPIVIIPILKQYFIMLQRNLIYTAITRGRKKVFLVGDPAAYAMAVNNAESSIRQTDLMQKLIAEE